MFLSIFCWLNYARKCPILSFRDKNTAFNDGNAGLILLTISVLRKDTLY